MIQPQDIYYYRDIIIPVIGDNCFVYKSGSEEMSLQEFVVNTLAGGRITDLELLTQMKSRGYYGLTLLKKHCFSNKEHVRYFLSIHLRTASFGRPQRLPTFGMYVSITLSAFAILSLTAQ